MDRPSLLERVEFQFEVNPVMAILGPRQCGKTTAAKSYLDKIGGTPAQNYFDLESPRDIERLADPMLALSELRGLIVIDEIQFKKEIFRTLRVLVDDKKLDQRYLVLGSASGELMQQSSETLAGRISYVELTPFTVPETGEVPTLWIRGGFPKSYLAKSEPISQEWRKSFIKTFLEQDIPKLGIQIPAENLRRFWMMLAHYQGRIFNASEIGGALGLTGKTIQRYVDILTETFMVRQLKPWFANISKRQVKSPKVFIRDSGIFHTLLGIPSFDDLLVHPKLGASWESFALEEIIRFHRADAEDCYFWSTTQGAELDLLIVKNGKRLGFEIKYSSSPKLTKSMQIVNDDLELDSLSVIYPGEIDYSLSDRIRVISLANYLRQAQ